MKKSKPTQKAKKKTPPPKAKTLRSLGGAVLKGLPPDQWEPRGMHFLFEGSPDEQKPLVRRTSVGGYPLPPDLEDAILYYVDNELPRLNHDIDDEWWQNDQGGNKLKTEADYPDWESSTISKTGWYFIRRSLQDCFRKGFFLALLRYADELKSHSEEVAMLAANRANSKKGTAAIKRKSEPKKTEARRLDRELRKTIKKKDGREKRIAEIMKVGTRQVWNYLNVKD